MDSFYTPDELRGIGLKDFGLNVRISRHARIYTPETISVGNAVRIDDFCILSGHITLGSHIHIGPWCGLFGEITMGDFSGFSSRVSAYAKSDDYSGEYLTNPMVHSAYTRLDERPIHVGRHVIVGSGSVILPGAVLSEGCAVGALCLAKGHLEPFSIYAGAPARKIRPRSCHLLELERDMAVTR